MRKKIGAWIGAGVVLLVFVVLTLALPALLNFTGARAWVLRAGLLVLGLVGAILLYVYLAARARAKPIEPVVEGGDATDQAIAAAGARLARSAATAETRIGRLPLGVVLGPSGSTKSSVVTHSGLDAELLAGEVYRGETVVPTDPVNVWYAHGTVLVEPGGRLLEDVNGWTRFVRHLRPNRLAAAVGRGTQAPRFAVVCFGCDEFLKPGAGESVSAAARKLRARLGEISQQLGIRLPFYVLFTRADRLPYFTDYTRNLSEDEVHQVVGATLPVDLDTSGAWAERESQRLNRAFGRIVHALSIRRVDILPREAKEDVRAGAYEFPRELRKISDLAVQFLLDVGRPSQLGVNPFVRGFYFTGVRPVFKSDVALDAVRPAPSAPPIAAGATSVFDARMLQQAAGSQSAPFAGRGGRKVPEWVFLHRLFRDVILSDDVAFRLTAGGKRVDFMRRGLIAAAGVASLIFAFGFTVSYASNRGFLRGADRAVTNARDIGGVPGTVGEEDFVHLDSLRARVAQLAHYRREGRPARFGWGLYRGEQAEPTLRRLYFERFEATMWGDTRAGLLQYLTGLPDQPNEDSDFGKAQDALAAHLLTTSQNTRSTPELLTPILLSYWRADTEQDSARALAKRQFDFFSAELAYENPYDDKPDTRLVARTQRFLRAFGREAYYRALITEASNSAPSVRYLGPPSIVRNEEVVPGAFTLAGYRSVLVNLDSVDQLFVRYEWIYGSQPPADKPSKQDLASTYIRDYVAHWQTYLSRASVQRFTSASDGAARLNSLAANNSPLFSMLALASRETAMDTTSTIARAFQPLHATVAPNADARAVTAGVLGYTNALSALATQLTMLAGAAGPMRDQMALQAATSTADVKREAGGIASTTSSGDAALTANAIQQLLRQPATFAEAVVRSQPTADMNAAGRSFCSSFAPVSRRFPFTAGAPDASVDEVNAALQKDGGVLWSFYQDVLQTMLTEQGRPRPNARVNQGFARFFASAAEFSNAVYRGGGGPSLVFVFQPEIPAGASEVVLQVDGDEASFTPTSRASRTFTWEAERSQEARLIAVFGGDRVTVASGQGPWAVFHLFYKGSWSSSGNRVEWRVPGRSATVVGQVSYEAGVPGVLRAGYLSPISRCTGVIVN